jgi:lipase chaperone LimK
MGLLGAVAAAALGLALYLGTAREPGGASAKASGADRRQTAPTHAYDSAPGPARDTLPEMLAGTSPPRLPIEAGGHLAHAHAVRDFFDYFLTSQDDLPATAIDKLVRRYIAAQLDGIPAAAEALSVWQRYIAYRTALAQLPSPPSPTGSKPDFDALQQTIDQRASLASHLMGDWNETFFGAELQRTHTDLTRLRIMNDTTLSNAEKMVRLAALDATLPPEERAERERVQKQQTSIDAIAQLQKQDASPAVMRAQLTQTLGPEAAERVAQMQQNEQAWQGKYADYAAQRAQIDQLDLPPQNRNAQVAQLRQHSFSNPGDAMRAASLDQGVGNASR